MIFAKFSRLKAPGHLVRMKFKVEFVQAHCMVASTPHWGSRTFVLAKFEIKPEKELAELHGHLDTVKSIKTSYKGASYEHQLTSEDTLN